MISEALSLHQQGRRVENGLQHPFRSLRVSGDVLWPNQHPSRVPELGKQRPARHAQPVRLCLHRRHYDLLLIAVKPSSEFTVCQGRETRIPCPLHLLHGGAHPNVPSDGFSGMQLAATRQQLQRFLGFAIYYRKFFWYYSSVVAALTALTNSKRVFTWSPEADAAFCRLKFAPNLQLPNPERQFVIEVNALDVGVKD